MQPMLAERLKNLREGLGMTQTKLAEKASIAQSIVSEVEAGSRNPRTDTIFKLAKALNVPLMELLEDQVI